MKRRLKKFRVKKFHGIVDAKITSKGTSCMKIGRHKKEVSYVIELEPRELEVLTEILQKADLEAKRPSVRWFCRMYMRSLVSFLDGRNVI